MARDINLVDRFASVTSVHDQQRLSDVVMHLTRQALADGFDAEDIKAILGFMVDCEVDVESEVFDAEAK